MSFGAVSPQLMLHAYAQGIFPMAENAEDHDLFWVDPKRRGILPLDGFHISRSLRRFLHGHKITATLNQAFDSVLQHCADREETWINPTLHANYTALNENGMLSQSGGLGRWRTPRRGVWHRNRRGVLRGEYVFTSHQWLKSCPGFFNHPSAQLRLCSV
jgi:leucyl/phenylalanyl-tRNA--protein transferase